MKKMKKNPMRQNERLSKVYRPCKGNLNGKTEVVNSNYEYDENGYARKSSAVSDFDPVAHFSQFNACDFALENIIAAGALGTLREGVVNFNSRLMCAENADVAVDNILNFVDNNVNNVNE